MIRPLVALPLMLVVAALAWNGRGGTAPSDPPSPPAPAAVDLAAATRTIDRLIDAGLAKDKQRPNPTIDDAGFVRRVYLDLAGRIPTYDEASAFLADRSPDKRRALVASLIGSEAWLSREFDWWADLLRMQTQLMDRYPGQPYIDWLKRSLRDNTPYDRMVVELLTASGPVLERGNGATGFWLRDAGMNLDGMATNVQTFLGTRVACAQCHDHPYDTWTRYDFYGMAGFTAGVNVSNGRDGQLRKVADPKSLPQDVREALRRLASLSAAVNAKPKASLPLPHDYQYKDHKPGEVVAAHALFGSAATVSPGEDPRAALARWTTATDNPRFAMVMANRIWRRAMGVGLFEPVDNVTGTTTASNPELLAHLTKLLVDLRFDLRRFQQAIYQSEAYQRAASPEPPADAATWRYPGPVVRRLGAEQIWDSLLTLIVPDLDAQHGIDGEPLYAAYEAHRDRTPEELLAEARELGEARGKGQELNQQIQQLRGEVEKAAPADRAALREQLRTLNEQRQALADRFELMRLAAPKGKRGRGGGSLPLLRASELPAPAPAGHFLRTFGQSDRLLPDNASDQASVPQALTLINGALNADLISDQSVLYRTTAAATDPAERIRRLFVTVLTREPTAREAAMAAQLVHDAPKEGWGDLAWALVNALEFKFLR